MMHPKVRSHQVSFARAVVVVLTAASAGTATAAEPAEQVAAVGQQGLEEVIVTARKREESAQSAPVSIAVLNGDDLVAQSADTFNKLNDIVPNVKINPGIPNGGGSASQIFIRGVGQYDYAAPGEPGVGVYIDDVYVSRSPGGNSGILDVERIEILRGPQGTLYGRNTIGGAVKVITRKPTGERRAEVGLTIGEFNRMDGHLLVEMPIADTIAAKFTAATRNRDGLGTNGIGQDLGEEDKQAVTGALRFQPSDSLDILFRADYHNQKQAGPPGSSSYFNVNGTVDLINTYLVPQTAAESGLPPPPFDVWGPAYAHTLDQCGKCVYSNLGGLTEPSRDWAEIWGVSLVIDKDLGSMDFKSVTAYREADIDSRRDLDMSPFKVVEVHNPETSDQLSQEFQLMGLSFNDRLQWLVGIFGFQERVDVDYHATILGGLYQAIGIDFSADVPGNVDATSVALFGEGTYALTDRLGLTAGVRGTRDEKEYRVGLFRPESGVWARPLETLHAEWEEVTPKVGLEFNMTEDVFLYANASKGYKAGGFNSRQLGGTAPEAFDPEFLTAYELGLKSRLADGRVTLNVAAFFNDYEDIQLVTVTDLGGGNVDTTITNAGKGEVVGGEIELVARPVPSLRLSLAAGILDTKYVKLGQAALDAGVRLTDEFANAPRLSANASGEYEAGLGAFGSIRFRLDASYSDEYFGDLVNTPQLLVPSYTQLNGRVTVVPASDKWEGSFFVTNITDKVYLANGLEVLALNLVESYYSRPREWGASLTYRF